MAYPYCVAAGNRLIKAALEYEAAFEYAGDQIRKTSAHLSLMAAAEDYRRDAAIEQAQAPEALR